MALSVNINGLTLCHRGSDGTSRSTLPDVCKTPDKGIPLPYQNQAVTRDLVKGTTSVFADGRQMIAKYGSQLSKSSLDEAGSMGGVVSGTNKAETDWISHSFTVFFEGQPACRLTDKLFMNHRNTVNMAGLKQRDLPEPDQEFYDKLCEYACECLKLWKGKLKDGQTYQDCVKKKIDEDHYDGKYPKPDAKMWREVPYDRKSKWDLIGSKSDPSLPTSNYIRPNSRRLDVLQIDQQGKPTKFLDMKFDDQLSYDAKRDYQKIAKRYTGDPDNFEEFRVHDKCNCDDDFPKKEPVTAPVTAPAPEKEGMLDKFGKALEESTGLKLAGGALVAFFIVSEVSRLYPPRNLVPVP